MESVVFVLQVSSIIEAVVKEVDKALQLLHSRVCFILYAGNDFTYNVFIKFALHCATAQTDHCQCCIMGWRA